jgi:small subunit ribosomal protein S9
MEILARAVGRRKEAVAQIQIIPGTGQFIINNKSAQEYLHNNSCSLISVKAPFDVLDKIQTNSNETIPSESNLHLESFDTIVKVKGGGLIGQAEAIKLGVARALCDIESLTNNFNEIGLTPSSFRRSTQQTEVRKQLKTKGYLTQDSRVKERRKYGLKKARKASQYHKR